MIGNEKERIWDSLSRITLTTMGDLTQSLIL